MFENFEKRSARKPIQKTSTYYFNLKGEIKLTPKKLTFKKNGIQYFRIRNTFPLAFSLSFAQQRKIIKSDTTMVRLCRMTT